MKIDATKDFKRSRAEVLACHRDPARYETVFTELGAQVERISGPPQMAWDCSLVWRDEPRSFEVEVEETRPDETVKIVLTSDLALVDMTLDFYDLPEGGCRVISSAELTARTMIAKLALQSLRLVRGKAESRLMRFLTALGQP